MRTIIKDALYYRCDCKELRSVKLNKTEYTFSESVSNDLIKTLQTNDFKAVFIGRLNIFSHSMNVLRKAVDGKDIIIIIGVSKILNKLKVSKECTLDLKKNKIIIEDTEYIFLNFDYGSDTDEEIEYNIVSKYICYKPDYYYSKELAEIIRKGFEQSKVKTQEHLISVISEKNRIWNYGIGFPKEIYLNLTSNQKYFYMSLLEYIDILQDIMGFCSTKQKDEKLVELLIKHFSYSTIFSFCLTNASLSLYHELKDNQLFEKCYQVFTLISPITDKENLTVKEIQRMRICLQYLLSDKEDKFIITYPEFEGIQITTKVIIFFVMHLFSDIRRCVIGKLVEGNNWFASLCTHKKRNNEVY